MCVITAYGVQCLVTGCRGSGAEQHAMRPEEGCCTTRARVGQQPCSWTHNLLPAPDLRQPVTKHCTP